MMLNWVQWKLGVPMMVAISAAYDLEARGLREATSMPLLNGEAIDVNSAVEALPPELNQVVVEYWLKKGTSEKRARACRCSLPTFYRRLGYAHERVRALLRAKRDEAARERNRYEQQRAGALVKLPGG